MKVASFLLSKPRPVSQRAGSLTRRFFRLAMSSSTSATPLKTTPEQLASFHEYLKSSDKILALLGAGLSASSGLPTFRGAGGLWRTHNATSLATPEAFERDPSFVWQFYSYRRHMALNASPNPAHFALSELAKRKPQFLTMSQNIDGLSPRAGHPADQLKLLHGSLYDLKCENAPKCKYFEKDNFTDPIVPALAIPQGSADPTATTTTTTTTANATNPDSSEQISSQTIPNTNTNPLVRGLDISSATHALPPIPRSSLPQCPQCHSLLRPGVVWFGEALPTKVLQDIDTFLFEDERDSPLDLMLVIGTSGTVFPAASYVSIAREQGARIAVVNPDPESGEGLRKGVDWFFQDDAARILPEMLRPVVGDLGEQ